MTYEKCCTMGMTKGETARVLKVSREDVRKYAEKHGLTFTTERDRGTPCNGYPSITAAAKALGITRQGLTYRINKDKRKAQ